MNPGALQKYYNLQGIKEAKPKTGRRASARVGIQGIFAPLGTLEINNSDEGAIRLFGTR